MSRRSILLVAAIVVVLVVLALMFQVDEGPELETRFLDWGLPGDLRAHASSLQELGLSGGVDHLTWLPRRGGPQSLRVIDAPRLSLVGLPEGIESLVVERTLVTGGRQLPHSIRILELRHTGISDLDNLPAKLTSLHIEGTRPSTLAGLPRLESLQLLRTGLAISDASLPSGLTSLEVSGEGHLSLHKLDDLRRLLLFDTEITSLNRLPANLRELRLMHNSGLDLEPGFIPDRVRELALEHQSTFRPLKGAVLPRNLTSLELVNTVIDSPSFLPTTLRRLVLRAPMALPGDLASRSELTELTFSGGTGVPPELPPGLACLTVLDPPAGLDLPPNLQSLTLINARQLDFVGGSEKLARLTLQTPSFDLTADQLEALLDRFPSLESLSLSGRVVGLPDLSGRAKLVDLDLSATVLTAVDTLPPNLTRLSIADSRIAALPALPSTLTELDVSNSELSDPGAGDPLLGLTHLTVHTLQLRRLGRRFPDVVSFSVVTRAKSRPQNPAP